MKYLITVLLTSFVLSAFAQDREKFLINLIPSDGITNKLRELRLKKYERYDNDCSWGSTGEDCLVIDEPCAFRIYPDKQKLILSDQRYYDADIDHDLKLLIEQINEEQLSRSYLYNQRKSNWLMWFDHYFISSGIDTYVEVLFDIEDTKVTIPKDFKSFALLEEESSSEYLILSQISSVLMLRNELTVVTGNFQPLFYEGKIIEDHKDLTGAEVNVLLLSGENDVEHFGVKVGYNSKLNLRHELKDPAFNFLHIEGTCSRMVGTLKDFKYDVSLDVYSSNDRWSSKLGAIKYRINYPNKTIDDLHFQSADSERQGILPAVNEGNCEVVSGPVLLLPVFEMVGSWSKLTAGPWGSLGWIKNSDLLEAYDPYISFKFQNEYYSHFVKSEKPAEIEMHSLGGIRQPTKVSRERLFSPSGRFLPEVIFNCEPLSDSETEEGE